MIMKKLKAIIVGAGERANLYAEYALEHPEELEIVGVAEPKPERRAAAAKRYGIAEGACYESAQDLFTLPQMADFVINGTMDQDHVATTIPLLKLGYDVLLEKPFATSVEELWELVEATKKYDRKVAICHVLRHAPFYSEIRKQIESGVLGDIINIQAAELVAFHHMAVAFVRGKWSQRSYTLSPMLMQKCCHDLDLITWFKPGVKPVSISSFGSNFQFHPDKAPKLAGTRCLVDCPIEADCLYSARKHYLEHPDRWKFYVWDLNEFTTEEQRIAHLNQSPFGKCVWKTGMDIVDHESVSINFEDGSTASLSMVGGAVKGDRTLHITGTKGELFGSFDNNSFTVRHIVAKPDMDYEEEIVDVGDHGDTTGSNRGHGGGDLRLVGDYLRYLRGEGASLSTTKIEDSVSGHLLGFAAELAREENRVVTIDYSKHL
jgi:predicted dehydrogenase